MSDTLQVATLNHVLPICHRSWPRPLWFRYREGGNQPFPTGGGKPSRPWSARPPGPLPFWPSWPSKTAQDGAKSPQERAKSPQERPKTASRVELANSFGPCNRSYTAGLEPSHTVTCIYLDYYCFKTLLESPGRFVQVLINIHNQLQGSFLSSDPQRSCSGPFLKGTSLSTVHVTVAQAIRKTITI